MATTFDHNRAFGHVLRQLRRNRQITQEQLAELSGLHRNYISLLENGQSSPTLDTLTLLAPALHLSTADLLRTLISAFEQPFASPPYS